VDEWLGGDGRRHYQLVFPARSLADADAISAILEHHPLIDPLAINVSEVDEVRALWEIAAHFPSKQEAQAAAGLLGHSAEAQIIPLPDRDWVRQSLDGLAPISAGRFFVHGSHDRARRRSGGISLEIDAGTAFGTGHHPTTEGCLLALDAILKRRRPRRVLDLGAGTGVLAIAALKGGALQALVTDIDAEAVRVSLLNARLNYVGGRLEAVTAAGLAHLRIQSRAPYDLIFANILARPLIDLAPALAAVLAPGGELILSGLTRDQIRWVSAPYRDFRLALRRRLIIGNWATLVLGRAKMKRPDRCRAGRSMHRARGPGWKLGGM
jgi:ribosomal protein L11 methyltransferase